jgi:hypothetical protein
MRQTGKTPTARRGARGAASAGVPGGGEAGVAARRPRHLPSWTPCARPVPGLDPAPEAGTCPPRAPPKLHAQLQPRATPAAQRPAAPHLPPQAFNDRRRQPKGERGAGVGCRRHRRHRRRPARSGHPAGDERVHRREGDSLAQAHGDARGQQGGHACGGRLWCEARAQRPGGDSGGQHALSSVPV